MSHTLATQPAALETSATPNNAAKERISSIDALRGFAVLGILYMNIVGFGLPWQAYVNPSAVGGDTGLNFLVWLIGVLFIEGTMRTLFSMLFGAAVIMITARLEARGEAANAADIYYRRNLWLIIFGLVHAYLMLWPGDILFYYGVAGLFLYPFRKQWGAALLLLGLFALSIYSIQMTFEARSHMAMYEAAREPQVLLDAGMRLTEEQEQAIQTWQTAVKQSYFTWTDEDIINLTNTYQQPTYWDILNYNASLVAEYHSSWFYLKGFWDIIGMMLIGMAFYKWGIFHAKRPAWLYAAMLIVGYGIGVGTNIYEARLWLETDFSIIAIYQGDITYNVGRLFTSLGHIGAVMLICQRGWMKSFILRLEAVGRLALSNYIMQTIVCNCIFLGIGMGLYGELQRYELYYVVVGIWLFQLWYSPIWLRYFRMGIVEWLWRTLIYWKLQSLRLPRTSMQPVEAQI